MRAKTAPKDRKWESKWHQKSIKIEAWRQTGAPIGDPVPSDRILGPRDRQKHGPLAVQGVVFIDFVGAAGVLGIVSARISTQFWSFGRPAVRFAYLLMPFWYWG